MPKQQFLILLSQEAFESLRSQLQRLTAENQQLRQELKDSIENQLSSTGPVDTTGGDIDPLDNVQQQVNNLQQVGGGG